MSDLSLTLPERVADEIIELIANNSIKLESRLVERDLMERFKVSQSVIREALLQLEAKGLVTIKPRRGTYVNNPTSDEIYMLFEVRKILDVFATRNAAFHHTEEDKKELRKLSSDAEKAYRNGDYMQFFRISRKFHIRVYECSGFSCLTRVYEDMTTLTDIFHHNLHVARKINLYDDVKGHAQICEAIESGDPDLCEKVVVQHLENIKTRDLAILAASHSSKGEESNEGQE